MPNNYKKYEKLCLAATIAGLGYLFFLLAIGGEQGIAVKVLAAYAAVASFIGLASYFYCIIRRQALEEQEALDESDDTDNALFDTDLKQSHVKQRNLKQFEKYFLPGLAIAIALGEFVLAWYLLKQTGEKQIYAASISKVLVSFLLIASFIFYMMGSYISGFAYRGKIAELRAVAAELIGMAYLSFFAMVACLIRAVQTDLDQEKAALIDSYFSRILIALLFLRAIEKIITSILEWYRPRHKDAELRIIFESRLNGLLSQPKSMFNNISETVQYQFGLNLDEQLFQKVITRYIPALLAVQLVLLLIISSFVYINPGEMAVLEKWGKPEQDSKGRILALQPGLHVKLPWPIENAYRVNTQKIHDLNIGMGSAKTGLWQDDANKQGELFLTATKSKGNDQLNRNLISLNLAIQYKVNDITKYLYANQDPSGIFRIISRRELVKFVASCDFYALYKSDKNKINTDLQERLQIAANAHNLGIYIVYAGIRSMQPPADVVPSYWDLQSAHENKRQQILLAEGEVFKNMATALSEKERLLGEARSYRTQRREIAAAEAKSYENLIHLYKKYPKIFRNQVYLNRLEKMRDIQKYVIASKIDKQVITVDLKQNKAELFELTDGDTNEE
ncbi:MAG: hypothetical protein HRT89_24735 [Lentisphaeria bacterium]|nr:SPFH domain-containing protein [Lentisphaeria bacterium]NQZ71264.1 hypothetical protein [Lentisphaeria bacterium]